MWLILNEELLLGWTLLTLLCVSAAAVTTVRDNICLTMIPFCVECVGVGLKGLGGS